jgi:putative ABC transport system permease protein
LINMRTLAVRSIRSNPTRFVATVLAVVVSTGFLGGTLVVRDSVRASLAAATRSRLEGVDLAVSNPGSLIAGAPGGGAPSVSAGRPRAERESAAEADSPGGGRPRQLGVNQNLPASLLPSVREVPGVRAADGLVSGYLSVLDGRGGAVAENVTGSLWIPTDTLNPYHVVEGRAPQAAGEVAIDARTAEAGGLALNAKVPLATSGGPADATLVGIVNFGEEPGSTEGDVLVSEEDAFTWFTYGRPEYQMIYVAAEPGVTPEQLTPPIQAAVGPSYSVDSGQALRDASTSGLSGVVDVIGYALIGFALVAMFVALFTIYNTFNIVVHQRTREFALLRAVGADGKQIKRSVRWEATLLGLGSSIAGYGLGLLMFFAITRFVPQVRDLAGTVTLRITPLSVLAVLVGGTLVTLVSAVVPAWRAARTRPVEAMRAVAVDRTATSRFRALAGLGLLGLGTFLLVLGALIPHFLVMVPGPPLLFLGVLVGGPVLAGAFGHVVERAMAPFGASMKLGAENVQRNPQRSSATALALVIGVFLVVLVTAGGGAVRDYAVHQLSDIGGPDINVIAFGGELRDDYVSQVRAIDGLEAAAAVYLNAAEIEGGPMDGFPLSAVDYRDVAGMGLGFEEGDPASLGPNDIVLPTFVVQQLGAAIGDPVSVQFGNGEVRKLSLGAITEFGIFTSALLSADTARDVDPGIVPVALQVKAESGYTQAVSDAMTALSRQYAGLEVVPGNFIVQAVRNLFNFVIAAVDGLLMVAVIIALFGIVNTLVLSVSERTREIGLLRAVGMTRR